MSEALNRPSRDLNLESLEERTLFDAVPIVDPELLNVGADGPEVVQGQAATAPVSRTEVVFIDSGVEDPEALLAGLGSAGSNLEFHFLDASSDGLEQIADYLQGRTHVDAIHILSHGDQAELALGDTVIRGDQLELYAQELQTIGTALTEGGDILIYGCDLAADDVGLRFVNKFAQLTNADVAASDDLTGHQDLGGDWDLEVETGVIETASPVSEQLVNEYHAVLAGGDFVLDFNNVTWNDGDTSNTYTLTSTGGGGETVDVTIEISGINGTYGVNAPHEDPASGFYGGVDDLAVVWDPTDANPSTVTVNVYFTDAGTGSAGPAATVTDLTFLVTDIDSSQTSEPSDRMDQVTVTATNGGAGVSGTFTALDANPTFTIAGNVATANTFHDASNNDQRGTLQVSYAAGVDSVTLLYDEGDNSLSPGERAIGILGAFGFTCEPTGPDLYVTKDDGVTTASTSDTLTYAISYGNDGNVDADGVVITEILPNGTTFDAGASSFGWSETAPNSGIFEYSLGTVGVGTSGSVNFAVTVDDPLGAGIDNIVNSVSIADDGLNGADLDGTDNSDQDTNSISAAPDLFVSKDDGETSATAGDTRIYTINYANNGDQDATGVVLTETLPPNTSFDSANSSFGWTETSSGSGIYTFTLGSVGGGSSGSVTFAISVGVPAVGVTQLTNTVSIADDGSNGPDPNTSDNTASDTDNLTPAVGVDLFVSKDDSQTTVLPNGTVIYTINYANNGDTAATGVVLTDTLPAGSTFDAANSDINWVGGSSLYTLDLGTLAAGASGSVAFAVTVDSPVAAGQDDLVNTVSIADDGSNGADADSSDNTASDTDTITAAPDLSVTKDDGVATTFEGNNLVYAISYANNGDQDATNVVLTETLDANSSFDSSTSTSGWTETSSGSGVFTLDLGSVAAGTGGTVNFGVIVDNPLPGGVTQITNNVSIADDGANGADPDTSDNSASDVDSVVPPPIGVDLFVSKDDSQTTVLPNGTVIYTINYANNGDTAATGVVLTDTLPAGSTFDAANSDINWVGGSSLYTLDLGTLAAGASGSVAFAVTVDSPVAAGQDDLVNTVSIADDGSNGADADSSDNTASDTDTITAAPDLSVTKDDGVATTFEGNNLVYAISYANNGDQDATNVVLTETLDANSSFDSSTSTSGWTETSSGSGVFTLDLGSVAAGTGGTVNFGVIVDNPLPGGVTQITNNVSIADDGANGADPDTSDNSASDVDSVVPPPIGVDLFVSKDDSQTTVLPNGTVIYTINYANNGDTAATGVVLTDTLPAGSTFDAANSDINWVGGSSLYTLDLGTLAAGASGSVAFAVTVDSPVAAGQDDLVNTVSIADDGSNGADADSSDNTASDTDTITAAPDLSVTKDDGVATTFEGNNLVYAISYANNGDQDATNVVLTETLDANSSFDSSTSTSGWTETSSGSGVFTLDLGSVAAGTGGTVNFGVIVDNPLPGGVTQITNNVSIADDGANGADPDTSDNSASDVDSVVPPPIGVDLFVSKDDSQTTVLPNGTVIYTINYANNGDTAATGVVLTDTLPAGSTFDAANSDINWVGGSSLYTLDLGTLAAGASGSVAFAVTVDSPVAAGQDDLVNTVSIADDGNNGADVNPANNTSTDTDTLDAAPNLFVSKDDGSTSTTAGSLVVYVISFGNAGNQDATGVVLTETLPPGSTFDAANSTLGWTETSAGSGVFTFSVGNLAAGSLNNAVNFAVLVDDPVGVSQLVNSVAISDDGANGQDPDQTDNNASDTDNIVAAGTPDLAVTKDNGQATVTEGGAIVYTIDFANNGTVGATGVVLTETLPPGSTYDAANSTVGWSETSAGSGIFTFDVGSLASGGTGSVDFAVIIDNPVAAGITQLVNSVAISDDGTNGSDPNVNDNSATDSDPIVGSGGLNLFVNKDDGVTVTNAGSTLIYSINYGNNGGVDATGVVLTETLPAGTSFDSANSSFGWNETSAGSGVFEFALGPVSSGTTGNVTFAINVDNPLAAGIDQLVNNVSIADDGANGTETDLTDNADSDTDVIDASPEYSIIKDDGITAATPGQQVTYTIVVANNGTQDGTGVVISDTFPPSVLENVTADNGGVVDASAGTINWNLGSLSAGSSVTLTVTATVVNTVGAGVDNFTNAADVTDDGSNGVDPNLGNNSDTDTDVLNAAPDLQVTKSDGGVTTNEGNVVVYTVDFSNNGNQAATGVVLTETLPANTTYDAANSDIGWTETSAGSGVFNFNVGNLAAGASGSVLFAVLVDSPLPAGTNQLDNSVTIGDDGSNGADPNLNDNTGTDSTPVGNAPAYSVSKVADSATIDAGGTLTYTIQVTNIGTAAGSDIVVNETFDIGVYETLLADNGGIVDSAAGMITWNISSMAIGETVNLTVTAQVAASFAAGIDDINCSVTVTDDDAPAIVSASETVALNATPELEVLKTTNAVAANDGATVIYTITYSNNGTQDATGVLIEEHIQPGTTFDAVNSDAGWTPRGDGEHIDFAAGPLAVGESRTVQYAITVTDVTQIGSDLSNLVDVSDDGVNGGDPIVANNSAISQLTTTPPGTPDYSVVKSGSATEVTADGTLTYTISVTNNGQGAGSDVVILETFDLGIFENVFVDNNGVVDLANGTVTWNVPTIAAGETLVLTVIADVNPTLAAGIDVVNCNVTVTDDDAPAVVSSSAQVTLLAAPELSITKSVSVGTVNNGDVLVYTITYANEGNQDATGVLIEEHIVAGTTFDAANSDAGWVDRGDSEHIDFAVGPMAAGEVRTINFAVSIDDVDQIGDRLDNLIEISDDGTNGAEADLSNNVQVLGISTRVLGIEFISKRVLLASTSTGAYDSLVPLNQLPTQQNNLPEAEAQVAETDPVVLPNLAQSDDDRESSGGLLERFSRLLRG